MKILALFVLIAFPFFLQGAEIDLKNYISFHKDFPKKGIIFQDMSPLLANPEAFQECIDQLATRYETKNIEGIVGLDARGFIIGAALAYKMGVPFYPVRKPGKIPGLVHTVSYSKEYGSDFLSISKGSISKGERILIVDDLIATGGSAKAAIELVQKCGAQVVEFATLLEIPKLQGREKLGVPSFNLIQAGK